MTNSAPVRPPLSDETPAPIVQNGPPPLPVVISRSLWFVSFAAGIAAVVFAFVYRSTQIEGVRANIVDLQPDAAAETITTVTYVVFLASVVAVLLIVLLEFALVRRMIARHGSARWMLALTLVPHVAAAALAESFLTFEKEGVLIAALLLTQGALAVLALLVSFLPAAGRWFRSPPARKVDTLPDDATSLG